MAIYLSEDWPGGDPGQLPAPASVYTINVYTPRGDLSQSLAADSAIDAVTLAYTFVRDRIDWVAHIVKDDTLGGLYIARHDDFSRRGAVSLQQCAETLRNWEWRS